MVCIKGDSTDVHEIEVDGIVDYTDYRLEYQIMKMDDKEFIGTKKVVLPSNGKFIVFLTPAETEVLAPQWYMVIVEVIKEVNGVIIFRRELSWKLQITPSFLN